MGTNFYFYTLNKELTKLMGPRAEPAEGWSDGWELHIAKTSCGWKPIFEEHPLIHSVRDLDKFYHEHSDDIIIYDEYGNGYTWSEFKRRVINFETPKVFDPEFGLYTGNWRCEADNDCEHIRHWEGEYADPEGYRFQHGEFC